jgi:hypothetical protein
MNLGQEKAVSCPKSNKSLIAFSGLASAEGILGQAFWDMISFVFEEIYFEKFECCNK